MSRRHPSSKREYDSGHRHVSRTYVIDNPSEDGVSAGITASSLACSYIEFGRQSNLTYSSTPQTGEGAQLGYSITPTVGLANSNQLNWSTQTPTNPGLVQGSPVGPVCVWGLRNKTHVGQTAHNQPTGSANEIYHNGIAVGFGGTFVWNFQFHTGLLPSAFFRESLDHGYVQFEDVTIEITPKHAKPWTAGNTGVIEVQTDGTTDPSQTFPFVSTSQAMGYPDAGTSEQGVCPANAALTHYHCDVLALHIPLSFQSYSVHSSALLWNQLGYQETIQHTSVKEIAERNGFVRLDPYKPIRVTRAFREAHVLALLNPAVQGAPDSGRAYLEPSGASAKLMGAMAIPFGGFVNPIFPTTDPTPPTIPGQYLPVFDVPLLSLMVDTNDWTLPYVNRAAGITTWPYIFQDFTSVGEAYVDGYINDNYPQMMNPPLEWDVKYIVRVKFFGRPQSGMDSFLGFGGLYQPATTPAAAADADEDEIPDAVLVRAAEMAERMQ